MNQHHTRHTQTPRRRRNASPAAPPRSQRGAVLIVSMLILVAVTLIGLSAMNTSQLGQKMSTNNQEVLRAFQDAESELSEAFSSEDLWRPASSDCTPHTGLDATKHKVVNTDNLADSKSCLLGFGPPPSGWSEKFHTFHFDFEGHSRTESGIESRVHLGGSQVMTKF